MGSLDKVHAERYELLRKYVPDLVKLKNTFGTRKATREQLKEKTALEIPEVSQIFDEFGITGSYGINGIEWDVAGLAKINELEKELKQTEAEFKKSQEEIESKSSTEKLRTSEKKWDVFKMILVAILSVLSTLLAQSLLKLF